MIRHIMRLSVHQAGILMEGAGFARQAETPFGALAVGDWITIGDIPGRKVSRQTTGVVRHVTHTFSEANGIFTHAIDVDVDVADPLRMDSNEAKALADAKLNVEYELAALGVYLPVGLRHGLEGLET